MSKRRDPLFKPYLNLHVPDGPGGVLVLQSYHDSIEKAFNIGLAELFKDKKILNFRVGIEKQFTGFTSSNEMFKTFCPQTEILKKEQVTDRPDFKTIGWFAASRASEFFADRNGLLIAINPDVTIFLDNLGNQVYPIKQTYAEVLNIATLFKIKTMESRGS
ncbi:MAG: hypothetical protein LBL21_04915 [Rickettsiales bacterium]|jgi:hypothetical protein|nr:hypothetical protein [Rickettsiales bacterium]